MDKIFVLKCFKTKMDKIFENGDNKTSQQKKNIKLTNFCIDIYVS